MRSTTEQAEFWQGKFRCVFETSHGYCTTQEYLSWSIVGVYSLRFPIAPIGKCRISVSCNVPFRKTHSKFCTEVTPRPYQRTIKTTDNVHTKERRYPDKEEDIPSTMQEGHSGNNIFSTNTVPNPYSIVLKTYISAYACTARYSKTTRRRDDGCRILHTNVLHIYI